MFSISLLSPIHAHLEGPLIWSGPKLPPSFSFDIAQIDICEICDSQNRIFSSYLEPVVGQSGHCRPTATPLTPPIRAFLPLPPLSHPSLLNWNVCGKRQRVLLPPILDPTPIMPRFQGLLILSGPKLDPSISPQIVCMGVFGAAESENGVLFL